MKLRRKSWQLNLQNTPVFIGEFLPGLQDALTPMSRSLSLPFAASAALPFLCVSSFHVSSYTGTYAHTCVFVYAIMWGWLLEILDALLSP